MRMHLLGCDDAGCLRLWEGRWGPFIGGEMGRTHFDLTSCPAGRLLNEAIGWDYEDPRH